MPHNELENVLAIRPLGNPNTEFMSPLGRGIRHHAIYPDYGKQQRKQRKKSQQQHSETPRRHGLGDDLVHRCGAGQRLIFVNALDGLSDRSCKYQRAGFGSQHERHGERRLLEVGHEDFRNRLLLEGIFSYVRDYADHFFPRSGWPPKADVLTNRVVRSEQHSRE